MDLEELHAAASELGLDWGTPDPDWLLQGVRDQLAVLKESRGDLLFSQDIAARLSTMIQSAKEAHGLSVYISETPELDDIETKVGTGLMMLDDLSKLREFESRTDRSYVELEDVDVTLAAIHKAEARLKWLKELTVLTEELSAVEKQINESLSVEREVFAEIESLRRCET